MNNLTNNTFSIHELTCKFVDGSLTPLDNIKNELKKLKSNAVHMTNSIAKLISEDIILTQAIQSTERYKNNKALGIFDGVPITIKDSVLCEFNGKKCEMGSMISYLDDIDGGLFGIATETSPQIKMLTDLGAIILCVTTCPELGHKGTTSSFLYGTTRNPHDITKTTAGSSGGSAALIALGIGNISIGTDGGGSIRLPSACCGVYGFKPSYNVGCCNHYSTPYIGVAGPISLHIDDIRLYMKLLYDQPNDYLSNNIKLDWSEDYMKMGINNINIAISKNYDGVIDYVDRRIWNHTLKFVDYIKTLGANVEFIEPPLSEISLLFGNDNDYYKCWCKLWFSFMGVMYDEYIERDHNKQYKYTIDPGLIEIIERSNKMTMTELVIANSIRDKVIEIMINFHKKYDLLITPTTPILPLDSLSYKDDMFMIDKNTNKIVKWLDCKHNVAMFTCLMNLTYQPAISMNIGYENTKNGKVPIGIQIIGRNNQDNLIVRAAYSMQHQFKPLLAKL